MKINIKVICNAKKEKIIKENDKLKVYVSSPAVDGKANLRLLEILSEYFSVKKKDIKIVFGERNRNKVIDIKTL